MSQPVANLEHCKGLGCPTHGLAPKEIETTQAVQLPDVEDLEFDHEQSHDDTFDRMEHIKMTRRRYERGIIKFQTMAALIFLICCYNNEMDRKYTL